MDQAIEAIIGVIIAVVITLALVFMVMVTVRQFGDGKEASYDKTATHCEVEEGFMGQQVVVCDPEP